jgi:hypothetical protein
VLKREGSWRRVQLSSKRPWVSFSTLPPTLHTTTPKKGMGIRNKRKAKGNKVRKGEENEEGKKLWDHHTYEHRC